MILSGRSTTDPTTDKDREITELPSTFYIHADHVIDARSYSEIVPKEERPHAGCWLRSEVLVHERTGLCPYSDLTQPVGCQTYVDQRTATTQQLKDVLSGISKTCRDMQKEYRRVQADPLNVDGGNGGSVVYKPFAAVINNYGWTIYARREDGLIEYFR